VSQWHYDTFGAIEPSSEAEPGWQVLSKNLHANTTLVTGAPLKNLGKLLDRMALMLFDQHPNLGRLFIQGGFAGDDVVPAENVLTKFRGKTTCPTYNLNGDPRSAEAVLKSRFFHRPTPGNEYIFDHDIRLVSKNVCHGVVYDLDLHERLKAVPDPHPGLALVIQAMTGYLDRRPSGKAFHDPLAAMCALDRDIGTWAEVEPYRERGAAGPQWGCRAQEGSGIRIITRYDQERFISAMTE